MFDPIAFIEKKRDGGENTQEELKALVQGVLSGSLPDYQVASWLMAVFFRGLNDRELSFFTRELAESGQLVRFPKDLECVDKHSTGGVGDKTTIVLVPLVASCGVPVAKLSGRGLGFTGGTVDKLESIPGMDLHLSLARFMDQVRNLGCAISGHSADLAPAEGKIYALRDVTGTVPSIPLIASSIVSKKMAGGASRFVFDVKCGSGAFMKTKDQARSLASSLVSLSRRLGFESASLITDMSQPLGRFVGNAVEVAEAIDTLKGKGPSDLRDLCLALGSEMVFLGKKGTLSRTESEEKVRAALHGGKAFFLFRRLVEAQGGLVEVLEDPWGRLSIAPVGGEIVADRQGVVSVCNAQAIGEAVRLLGGGRLKKEDSVDLSVGIEVLCKIGDPVEKGQPLLRIRAHQRSTVERATWALRSAFEVTEEELGLEKPKLILEAYRLE